MDTALERYLIDSRVTKKEFPHKIAEEPAFEQPRIMPMESMRPI
jgi:hypothetical protein